MGFNYNGFSIADIDVTQIAGRGGIGIAQLCFSIKFNFVSSALKDIEVRDLQVRVSASADPGNSPEFLGMAIPEVAFSFKTGPGGQGYSHMLFMLALSESQLFALERVRAGQGLQFHLKLSAHAFGPNGLWPQHDEVSKRANLSEWVQILKDLQSDEYLVLGLALPRCADMHPLAEAVERIKSANKALLAGRYDGVVADCRMAIESTRTAAGEDTASGDALGQFRGDRAARIGMSKLQREFVLAEAVRHYSHLAHHVNDHGGSEYFSRDDAHLLLATASAVVSSCLARIGIQHKN